MTGQTQNSSSHDNSDSTESKIQSIIDKIVKEEVRQKENKSTKEKLMDLKDEFVYYVTKDVVIEHPKKKVKILKL